MPRIQNNQTIRGSPELDNRTPVFVPHGAPVVPVVGQKVSQELLPSIMQHHTVETNYPEASHELRTSNSLSDQFTVLTASNVV
jgi:hypothetical protein